MESPLNYLFDVELLRCRTFPENLVSKITIGAMFHHQVIMVTLHFVIEITKSLIEVEYKKPYLPDDMNIPQA